jgi:PAS domain S-box-containing protein
VSRLSLRTTGDDRGFTDADRLTIGATALMAVLLAAVPLADLTWPGAPVLLFIVPIGLCAARFGTRGGLCSAVLGVAVATVWLLAGDRFAHGSLDFATHSIAFMLVGTLVGSAASQRLRLEREIERHNELSLDLICTASFGGYFTKLNPAWTQVLGYQLDELKARPFLEFVHPDDIEPTRAEVDRQTRAGEPVLSFQNRYRHADGSYRWLEWTSRPDPKAQLLYAVARDITTRKQAEEAIDSYRETLERAVGERTRELEESRLETLSRLALAAEYRDDETFEHTERVGHAAALIAKELGLSDAEIALIRQAAPLHDVGKLGISDTILLKPGRLTMEEFEEVKKHTTSGAKLLAGSSSRVLQFAEQIALSHHEWWNGQGYPQALAGAAIPLCARIVAVCDVFDALTHQRPYKPAWPVEQAVDEIHRLIGEQFDPAVIAAFDKLDYGKLVGQRPSRLLEAVA